MFEIKLKGKSKMLELKSYTRDEIAVVLNTKKDNENIKKKMNTLGVEYNAEGRGANRTFEIINIPDEFKAYCMTELNFNGQTDFSKLKYFAYYFFSDNDFRKLSQDQMCEILGEDCAPPCRQTISSWYNKFKALDLFTIDKYDCLYFSIYNGERKEITHEQYKQAWAIYWKYKAEYNYCEALNSMCHHIGGYPLRIYVVQFNAFYIDTINKITEYAVKSINNDIKNVQFTASDFDIDTEDEVVKL